MQKRLLALALASLFAVSAFAQSWVGGSGNNVTTAANWSPSGTPANNGTAALTFGTTSFPTVVFDTAYSISSLATSGTTAYVIGGSALSIGSGGITDSSSVGIAVNNPVTLTASATIATTNTTVGAIFNIFNSVTLGANNLTLSATNATGITGNITGTGSLTVNGPSQVFLSGTGNTWSGGTTINSGVLQIGDVNGTMGSLPGNVTNNGTLNFKPSNTSYSYGGVISGSGGIQMLGTNTLTLTGANTYAGQTLIGGVGSGQTGGTLKVGAVNALPTGTTLNFGAAGSITTLDVAANQTVKAFAGTNTAAIIKIEGGSALTVTLGTLGSSTSFSGTIQDGATAGGALVVGPSASARTFFLNGNNTYTGGTTIQSGGTLALGSNGTTGSIVGNVANDGTLLFNRGNAMTFSGTVSGSGAVVQGFTNGTTTGTTTLTAANTYSGGTSVFGGALMVANSSGSATGTGVVTVTPGTSATTATFGGHGAITGTLTLNSKATVEPTGLLAVGATTFNGNTRYKWDLFDAAAAAGTGYGTLAVTGGLTLNATATAGQFLTIAPFTFDGSTSGLAANFDPSQNYSFTLATSAGITGFNSAAISLDLAGFQNSYTGTWSVATSLDGNNLLLNYTGAAAIPEPSTSAIIAGLATGVLALKRRKARSPQASS